jgi:predicted ATPase/signal transduction histidine kinase
MPDLSSYALSRLRAGDLTLYRGSGNGMASALVVTAENASLLYDKRLEHEYALRAELDGSSAARPVALARHNDHLALVLEDPGGVTLDRLLGRPLGVPEFLRIAIPVTNALGRVHARGLIHKDIKPGNVLFDNTSGGAWLIGFGIASRLPRERQTPEAPEVLAGTLAYMAPEQTGRMNRSIDARCDLYSLGVTFYEMLTGMPPFSAADPLEWVHCHIARHPVPPDERVSTVPAQLSAIVMKLLAKNAEERYQTAAGLEADLRQCLRDWEQHGCINLFPLRAREASDRLVIPEKLYGRNREIDSLLAAFERVVAHGAPQLVLVSGYSGIGKSSVVNELHKVLVPPRGLFAAGKFDQYKRDIPYSTLAQAFQTLVRQILVKTEMEVDDWRSVLAEAVGPNGQLIINLVPEVEFIIGKQPPVPDLPPQDSQNRFQLVLRRFIGAFARPEHPLALFLDDLQWLDAATLDLLEHLITHSEVRHLLLVGAYRDNEVNAAHPLMRTLEAIRRTGARVEEIVLAPLGLDDIGQLVADTMLCEAERARPLAQLLREKTDGNPFFVIQFFMALAEEGLLAFDPATRAWQWEMDRIRARNYTDNVVDLVAEKMKRFSTGTQQALMQLACLGNIAEVATLAVVLGETEGSVHSTLWEAARAGLVFHQDNTCKFLHDRIQQAAYSLIPHEHRAATHLHIGRVLLAGMKADPRVEYLFDVANHLNRGAALLTDGDEKARLATIDLRAGRRAKASAAYASARSYFSAGITLLDERDWDIRYELTFSLWLERVECDVLTGDFERAEQLIAELLPRGASKVDQAAVYNLKVLLQILKSENQQAVDSALACLRLFGIDMPSHPTWDQVQVEYDAVCHNLGGRSIESLIDLPLMIDPELQAAMQLLAGLISATYFTDVNLYCLHICRMVNLTMQHGTSRAAAHAYGYFGFILGPVFHRYADADRFAKVARDLIEKRHLCDCQAKVYYASGTVAFWTQPVATAIDFARAGFRTAAETGDLTFACYGMQQIVTGLLLRNDPLDAVWRQSEIAVSFAREAKYSELANILLSQQRFIATMLGRTASFSTFSDAQFDEATFEAGFGPDRLMLMVSWYWILKLKARFLSGDYADALAAAYKIKPLLSVTAAHTQLIDYFFYAALTVAARYESASADEQISWRELLTAHERQLREWAESYPPTFIDKHMLVLAEIARLEGRDLEAMGLYDRAIRSAREHDFVQNEGLAHEVAARFYAARGFETTANAYLLKARSCYLRWGAEGKVRQMDLQYPRLVPPNVALGSGDTIGTSVEELDLTTVVKVSQAVAGEIEFDKLISILMTMALEHAGGARGLLILPRGEEMWIEADATIARDTVVVCRPNTRVSPAKLPDSVYRYVLRTRDSMLLDDASRQPPFSADEYVRRNNSRSILCLPLIKQTKLIGMLYVENSLTSHIFTPERIALLKLVASQAATSLENARLYSELRDAGVFLAQAQRLSHTGSFGWRPSSGEIYWSDETFRIFEYDRTVKPSIDLIVGARIHPEDAAIFYEDIERAARDESEYAHEYRLRMPDGRVKFVNIIARPKRSETGGVDFFGAAMDVTEQKLALVERDRLEQRLRQAEKMEAVGRVASGIAHDFNGVLANVFTYGEMVLDKAPENSSLKRHAQGVLTAATRGRELVAQILDYSGARRGTLAPVDAASIVSETVELLRGSFSPNIRLEWTAPESPLVVIGDATRIRRVLMNLCSNAVQAMSGGGTLRLELDVAEFPGEQALSHGTLAPGRYVRIVVADTGCGMDDAMLTRIFEPFFTTKESGHGTGLGLSLVYTIVTEAAGAIDVKSMPGQGSTFTVYMALTRGT